MRDWVGAYAPIIGRILVGGYFLWNGIEAALNLPSAVASIAVISPGQPVTIAVAAIFIEVLGGLALILGYWVRTSTLILAIYTIASGVFYMQSTAIGQTILLQQMAIVGGLLYIAGTAKSRR